MKHSFRQILIGVTLMVIGIAVIPLLSVQYLPTISNQNISISYSWPDVSAMVIEQEVTSMIEGGVASIGGVSQITSRSTLGSGFVNVQLKKGARLDVVRFDISTKIRSLYSKLPKGVSYPYISSGSQGNRTKPLLSYTINADIATWEIKKQCEESLTTELSKIDGVDRVVLSGATPYEWEISFDSEMCSNLSISPNMIVAAFNSYGANFPVGINSADNTSISFTSADLSPSEWEMLEIANIDGHIVYLGDVAKISFKEKLPSSYRRINGLNNILLTIYSMEGSNNLELAKQVKAKISELQVILPPQFSMTMVQDSSIFIKDELSKIYYRTGLSVLILLVFIWFSNRNLRYMLIIAFTMLANVLIAMIFYWVLDLQIHLYSLAGITVSFGMIIDTSIIMVDHYGRFHNRKIFLAILGALLTTIGALSVVFFLPDEQKQNLVDFSVVVVVNLIVSMGIALFLAPALLDRFPISFARRGRSLHRLRRVVRFTRRYQAFLLFARRKRWVFVLIVILGFGLPLNLLPDQLGRSFVESQNLNSWQKFYNSTIGSTFYQKKAKPYVEGALGGTMGLFARNVFDKYKSTEPKRPTLHINAMLPDGCTVHQLNTMMIDMENFLSGFEQIETFLTEITSYDRGEITVSFTAQAERDGFIYSLKDIATAKAISLGGANWSIFGVGQGFSNRMGAGWKTDEISIKGYNYNQVCRIAKDIVDTIKLNPRVSDPSFGNDAFSEAKYELNLDFDEEKFALYGINPRYYYSQLSQRLYTTYLRPYYDGSVLQNVSLVSNSINSFDAWKMNNDMLKVEENNVKLSDFSTMEKNPTGMDIFKSNQQYAVMVTYNFIGTNEMGDMFRNQYVKSFSERAPIGFSVAAGRGGNWWGNDSGLPYKLLLLIVAIIFVICAILFESLRQPFVILTIIPISYIGVFLVFYIFELPFDQGGFASFVLLAGMVVNAAIYLINEYNIMLTTGAHSGVKTYLRCFNRKIVPIALTIFSTVLGLIPFVVISREPFWYSFAVGSMGGMVFSILVIYIFLPIFLPLQRTKRSK